MQSYEIYVLFVCIISLILFTTLLGGLILYVVKLSVQLINAGAEDEEILKGYTKARRRKRAKGGTLDHFFSTLFCVLMFAMFAVSVYAQFTEKHIALDVPQARVVLSDSMQKKHEKNTYLTKYGLDDQFSTYDLIITRELPDEFDLQLYDIVVYEFEGKMIIHRIVAIEEPNLEHPTGRLFRLQGDNVEYPDTKPVQYSQMRAIYQGERVPFVGSFMAFMQTPAGYVCIIVMIIGIFFVPSLERKIEREKSRRLGHLLAKQRKKQKSSSMFGWFDDYDRRL